MSLNGLEDAAVLAAFESAAAAPGGWFLVKYASRDEVELHGSGSGSDPEIRAAVASYKDPSPLYGLLNYRDHKIILKYQPDDCSRLVQARASVHFNMICDRFQPYDRLYEISDAKQLHDAQLAPLCGLEPAEPAVSETPDSPSSPQRRRRLGEIDEEDDQDQEPSPTRRKSRHIADDSDSEAADADAASNASALTGPPVTLNSDLAKSPEASSFASTDLPPTFVGAPSDQPELLADPLESPSRPRSQSSRTADLYPYPSYKPKVKLAPRPSEAPGRPGSSNSATFRSISSLPAGFKASKAKKEKKHRDKDRDKDDADHASPIPEIAIDSAGLVIPAAPDGRPHTSSGSFAAGLSSMIPPPPPSPTASLPSPKDRITPEKARLMKAMKLREKKMGKAQAQAQDKPAVPVTDAIPNPVEDDIKTPTVNTHGLADVPEADNEPDAEADDADTTTEGPSQLDEDDDSQPSMLNIDSESSPTTTVNTDSDAAIESTLSKALATDQASELTVPDSHPPSPVLEASFLAQSTKASSISESTNETVEPDNAKEAVLPVKETPTSEPDGEVEAMVNESLDEPEAVEAPRESETVQAQELASPETTPVQTEGTATQEARETALPVEPEVTETDASKAEEAEPVKETVSVQDETPVEQTKPIEEVKPVDEVKPLLQVQPTEQAESVQELEPTEETKSVEDVKPLQEDKPTEETKLDNDQPPAPEAPKSTETPSPATATEPQVSQQNTFSEQRTLVSTDVPLPSQEVKVSDEPKVQTSAVDPPTATAAAAPVEKTHDIISTADVESTPKDTLEQDSRAAALRDAAMMPPPPRPLPKAEADGERSPRRRPAEPIRTNMSEQPQAEKATQDQAKRTSVNMDYTPVTPMFPAPSLRSSSPSRPYSSSSTRTVSQPTLRASAVILPSDVTASSARSVSSGAGAAYIHKITQQSSSSLAPKSQGKIGSSISQRIKALEQLSGSTNPGVPPPRPTTSSTFYSVRKSVIMDPPRPSSVSERGGGTNGLARSPSRRSRESVIMGSTNRDRSSSVASRMSRFELDRGESSVQVTSRIVRDIAPHENDSDKLHARSGHEEEHGDRVTDQEVDKQNTTDGPHHTVTLNHRMSTLNPDSGRSISPVRSSAQENRVSRDLSRRTGAGGATDGETEVSQHMEPERMPTSEDHDHASNLSPTSIACTDSSAASFVSTSASVSTSTTKRPRRRSSLTVVKDFIKDRRRSITSSSHDVAPGTASQPPSRPPSTYQNSSAAPTSAGGYMRRLSIGSHRSSVSRERDPVDGTKSPTQGSDMGSGDDSDRRLGKAGRFMQRLSSGFSSANSRGSRSPISMAPTVQEETIAAMGSAAVKARPKLKPTGDPEVSFMGDVNVQFPDNLLWKRRTMGLDTLGFLILTPVTASGSRPDKLGGTALKRFHLSDFRMPYVPDMELQELPNSVCLDFLEGSSLQIACGDRNGQVSVLNALQAAHKTHSN
ncbi:hypothetical protein BROUX41_003408 [Berkeleyomyces rouxiae]|uniref:uncharacterized protein n=1 Tax=Berkeleyomyces rouxiae TaxID=2035830 RepID=UPI003B82901F